MDSSRRSDGQHDPGPEHQHGDRKPGGAEDENLLMMLWREGLRALTLGWDLAVPIFSGVLLGSLMDRWLGTGHLFTLGLLMLGVMISYYNLGRVIQRLKKLDDAREKDRNRMDTQDEEE